MLNWIRVKSMEGSGVIGWFESRVKVGDMVFIESIVTLTEGLAHVVHRGKVLAWATPAGTFGSKPETIMDKVSRFLK